MRIACSLLLLLSLSACSLFQKKPQISVENIRDSALLSDWQMSGRVSIKTKDDSNIISILWLQKNDDINLRLYGSFGKTYARLIRENGLATLTVDDKSYTDTNAQYLLWRVLGWNLPIDEMIFWVKGIPQEKSPVVTNIEQQLKRDEQGYLLSFNYENWQAQYSKYKQFGSYRLPTKFKLTHPELSIRFSIQKWLTFEAD